MTQTTHPKRRDAARTKANILTAAQQAFAESGYSQTGIRDIAVLADVSPPMVLRYFGSKAGLFEAALLASLQSEQLFAGDKQQFGSVLAGVLLDASRDIKQPSMVVLSIGDPEAREIAIRVIKEKGLAALAKWLGPPAAKTRALEIMMLGMGFVLLTRQLPMLADDKKSNRELGCWFAESVQQIVDKKTRQ